MILESLRALRPAFGLATALAFCAVATGHAQDTPAPADSAAQAKRERLLKLYTQEAEEYTIYRDAGHGEKTELRKQPVYLWSNPLRAGGQDGAVFVWTCRGRAEVLGTVFSFPSKGPRGVVHEFHSLATTVLDVTRSDNRPEDKTWAPAVPGVTLEPVPDAPAPERTPAKRLSQMHTLTRAFSGTTRDDKEKRWELRLLPQPLYRYESTDPDVLDGAVFAFVTSAGTDPEAFLLLEARKTPGATTPTWRYGVGRYTDMELRIRLKGKEILSVPFLYGTDRKAPYRAIEVHTVPAVEAETNAAAR